MDNVVGIDVAQAELVVLVLPGEDLSRWANDEAGRAGLVAMLRQCPPTRIVLEGTGGLERPIVAALADAGLPTVVANPAQVRAFARGIGRHAKTDPIDAGGLAQFAAQVQPPVRPLADEAARALRALVVRRRQVRDLRAGERQRRKRAEPIAQASIDRMLTTLTTELPDLEAAIATQLTLDPTWRARQAILESVPGIGRVVAATVIAALVGVAPRTQESGRGRRPATIGGGRGSVRAALYLATVTATQHNPVIRAFYQRLLAAPKPPKVALIAAERKLLGILTALLRDGALWQDPPLAHLPTP